MEVFLFESCLVVFSHGAVFGSLCLALGRLVDECEVVEGACFCDSSRIHASRAGNLGNSPNFRADIK